MSGTIPDEISNKIFYTIKVNNEITCEIGTVRKGKCDAFDEKIDF